MKKEQEEKKNFLHGDSVRPEYLMERRVEEINVRKSTLPRPGFFPLFCFYRREKERMSTLFINDRILFFSRRRRSSNHFLFPDIHTLDANMTRTQISRTNW